MDKTFRLLAQTTQPPARAGEGLFFDLEVDLRFVGLGEIFI